MARDDDCDGIQRVGMSHGARCFGSMQPQRQLAIGPGFTCRYGPQCLPDEFLKRAAAGTHGSRVERVKIACEIIAELVLQLKWVGAAPEFDSSISAFEQHVHARFEAGKIQRADRFSVGGEQDAADWRTELIVMKQHDFLLSFATIPTNKARHTIATAARFPRLVPGAVAKIRQSL